MSCVARIKNDTSLEAGLHGYGRKKINWHVRGWGGQLEGCLDSVEWNAGMVEYWNTGLVE